MSREAVSRDRLQPSLLDRLSDFDLGNQAVEQMQDRLINKTRLRQVILRDLAALFNATEGLTKKEQEQYPLVAASTLNYGVVSLTGELASGIDMHEVEAMLRTAIRRFEPRILPESVTVKAVIEEDQLSRHNTIGFEIKGRLWAEPYPLDLLLRTEVDIESGQAQVKELTRTAKSETGESGSRSSRSGS